MSCATRTCASTRTARAAQAGSTSTPPTRPCASRTCPPASSWPFRWVAFPLHYGGARHAPAHRRRLGHPGGARSLSPVLRLHHAEAGRFRSCGPSSGRGRNACRRRCADGHPTYAGTSFLDEASRTTAEPVVHARCSNASKSRCRHVPALQCNWRTHVCAHAHPPCAVARRRTSARSTGTGRRR